MGAEEGTEARLNVVFAKNKYLCLIFGNLFIYEE